jgi:hypothetical protein
LRREEVNMNEKKKGKCMIISKPMTVSVCKGEVRCKADFLKEVFSKEQMKELEVKIRNNDHLFEKAEDTTRRNYSLFIGHWASRNYHKPGNPVYPAGKGGWSDFLAEEPIFHYLLENLGERATEKMKENRPELFLPLIESGWRGSYGMFHLFTCVKGASKYHIDRNDYVAFLFLISNGETCIERCKGGLELKDAKRCFNWKVGDAVILDSRTLTHRARHFQGNKKERLVGVFIIIENILKLKTFLKTFGRENNKLILGQKHREKVVLQITQVELPVMLKLNYRKSSLLGKVFLKSVLNYCR